MCDSCFCIDIELADETISPEIKELLLAKKEKHLGNSTADISTTLCSMSLFNSFNFPNFKINSLILT